MGIRCYYSRRKLSHLPEFLEHFFSNNEQGIHDLFEELPLDLANSLSIDKSYSLLGKLCEKIDPSFKTAPEAQGHSLIYGQKDWIVDSESAYYNYLDWDHIQLLSSFLAKSEIRQRQVFFDNFAAILAGYLRREWPDFETIRQQYLRDPEIDWELDIHKLEAKRKERLLNPPSPEERRAAFLARLEQRDPYQKFKNEIEYYFVNLVYLDNFIVETTKGEPCWISIHIG